VHCRANARTDDTTDSLRIESVALCRHLDLCREACGRGFTLQCHAEALDRFLAPRFLTTLLLAGLVIAIGALVL
jgi:hypothetical protein